MVERCTTCNKELTNDFVEFKCPNCLKNKIKRCSDCKKSTKEYACGVCGFIGP